ncbi:MAG: 1-deoxy-D-xylulose-5-phosphate synthase N-terminal domain-containing protein, partial [Eubacteriales bacterium]
VVGDGSFSNGMVYEAIENCAGRRDLKLIILLNDNEMSISRSVGGMSAHLSRIRTSKQYMSFKHSLENILNKIPFIGHKLAIAAKWVKDYIKRALAQETVFEKLGIPYTGLVDGSDIEKIEDVLREIKSRGECCLVHMVTKKGKGYNFAEAHPENYHSVEGLNVETGDVLNGGESFSSRFGEIMCRAAAGDSSICAVTVAMCAGTGLLDFSRRYPTRFFDVGIAEEHAVAFCGGLSLSGMKPVCAMYSTFAQRSFDQLFHDVAIQRLPLTLALDRCGLVPEDGITHQGIYDVSLFSSIPGVVIYSPETYDEQEEAFTRSLASDEINIVRYPKGAEIEYDREGFVGSFDLKYRLPPSPDAIIVTYGRITANAVMAAKMLSEAGGGYSVGIIKLVKIYPFDADEIIKLCCGAKLVYLLEEGMKSGGIAEKLAAEFACDAVEHKANGHTQKQRTAIRAIDGRFVPHGDIDSLYRELGFTPDAIAAEMASLMKDCPTSD